METKEHRFTYKYWEYWTETDCDDDVCKIWHEARHTETGEKKLIRHTPYEGMSIEMFSAHVDLGFPDTGTGGNWFRDTILARHREEFVTA